MSELHFKSKRKENSNPKLTSLSTNKMFQDIEMKTNLATCLSVGVFLLCFQINYQYNLKSGHNGTAMVYDPNTEEPSQED